MVLSPIRMYPAFRCGSLTPWGGDRLVRDWGKPFPCAPAGEALEVSCLPGLESTDAQGRPLSALIAEYGERLVGRYAGRAFPLLLKLIDTAAPLSVQVHPDDAYAAVHEGGKLGKTEAWLVLAAEPDAEIIYGLRPGTTRDALEKACRSGDAVEALLHRVKVRPGDVCYIPAGCVHAICAGVTVYEIQQSSDITYRFYDYGRRDAQGKTRPLHIAQALSVTDLSFAGEIRRAGSAPCTRILEEAYFSLDILQADASVVPLPPVPDFGLLTALTDGLTLQTPAGALSFERGATYLLPAGTAETEVCGKGCAALSIPRG